MRLKRKRFVIGPALIAVALVWCASAQIPTYTATTESQDLRWNRPTRVRQARIEVNGRTIETQVVEAPSINGGYALVTATEKETIREGPNTIRVVERSYMPDPDGRRQLSWITEADTTTVPGKNTTTVRTRYDRDLDGHLQAMERQVEESVSLSASTRQTRTIVFQLVAGTLAPVRQTVTAETRKENGLANVQRTVSVADSTGKFIPTLVSETVEEQTGAGAKRKEERTLEATGMVAGEGQMSPIQRTVTQEWKDSEAQEHRLVDTYSMFTAGIAPDHELHLTRQVSTVQQVAANGDTRVVQEIAAKNPGSITDPPRRSLKIIEITEAGAGGQFETKTIMEAPGSSGAMQPIATSNTRGWKRGND